ncbi:MAG: tyrosine-type recombinase/integrase [Devosia sp.]|uniref:tyrosine-type recombinase/integrase n=1 Tax=Devosia sp. 66-22 TaxID=1895753 RepID=UPI000926D2E0|nr:site-specific integrase [Devosia sp. 66-22]MBN9347695.1 tyrosine-type recombinase/integrase [Devosia sp.]OJX51226.1 MAG: hypothetical protein BGO81_11090 [Devosia sp. 66-22]
MAKMKLTKTVVDKQSEPREARYSIFDTEVTGFALRVFPSGEKSWVLEYKPAPGGKTTPTKRVKIGNAKDVTADQARGEAKRLRALVSLGKDPQAEKVAERAAKTVKELGAEFLASKKGKLKPGSLTHYSDLINRIITPAIGNMKAKSVTAARVRRLHEDWSGTPTQANRILSTLSAMYAYGADHDVVPTGFNPARRIEKFTEQARGDVLKDDQLARLGDALREAETTGIPWDVAEDTDRSRFPKKAEDRVTRVSEHAIAAIRLLLFTGCRLREILHLKWTDVDFERGLLLFPEHKLSRKKGTKAVVLNAPAMQVLTALPRIGKYVVAGASAGTKAEKPRSDLKKPWALVTKRAGLDGTRLHDLRHNYASFGAGAGMGLQIVGKLLGHAQPSTTDRYSHLDADPLRRASNTIATAIAAKMGEAVDTERESNVVPIKGAR